MNRDRSITEQLFLFACAFGAPLLVLSAVIGWAYVLQEDRRIENNARSQAQGMAAQLDNLLSRYTATLDVLSTEQAVSEGNVDDLRARLSRIPLEEGIWFTLRTRDGQQLLNTLVPPGAALPKFAGIGDPVIFQKGERYISNLIWAPVRTTWAVTVSAPVRNAAGDGEVRHALTVAVPAGLFAEFLERATPKGWVVAINDRQGKIVARSLNHDEVVGKPMARQGWDLTKGVPPGETGLWKDIYNLEGTRVRGAYHRMQSTGWLIGVTALPVIYEAPRKDILLVGTTWSAVALLLGALLAALMGRRITTALEFLQVKAGAMREMRVIDVPHTPVREVNAVARLMRETAEVLRKRQEQQTTLVQELNHRVKNTLATIQAISRLTMKNSTDPASFQTAFSARLLALSHTHNLLTETAWTGVGLHELLATELEPFQTGSRVIMEGPDVTLSSRIAVALGMAIHELATNAAKYGALHYPNGTIRVRWSSSDELKLEWSEDCGQPIAGPDREGFGTRLVQQTIVRELLGRVEQQFRARGLHLTVTVPLDR